jgi:hypothetical protein
MSAIVDTIGYAFGAHIAIERSWSQFSLVERCLLIAARRGVGDRSRVVDANACLRFLYAFGPEYGDMRASAATKLVAQQDRGAA